MPVRGRAAAAAPGSRRRGWVVEGWAAPPAGRTGKTSVRAVGAAEEAVCACVRAPGGAWCARGGCPGPAARPCGVVGVIWSVWLLGTGASGVCRGCSVVIPGWVGRASGSREVLASIDETDGSWVHACASLDESWPRPSHLGHARARGRSRRCASWTQSVGVVRNPPSQRGLVGWGGISRHVWPYPCLYRRGWQAWRP